MYAFLNIFKYASIILDKYTIIEQSQTSIVYNWLQYFSQDSLSKEFKDNGFKITGFYVAGTNFDHESLEFAVVAEKI